MLNFVCVLALQELFITIKQHLDGAKKNVMCRVMTKQSLVLIKIKKNEQMVFSQLETSEYSSTIVTALIDAARRKHTCLLYYSF